LTTLGFKPLFECESDACGGYDFRYSSDVLAEPDMHVDLGDFRYFVAEKTGPTGPEYVSVLVSRSAHDGFVQLTRIGRPQPQPPELTTSTKSAALPAAPVEVALQPGQPRVLEDLVFPSGSADLAAGDYKSLTDLAAWLAADPTRKAKLVGHTDASGAAEANVRLSKARAESVRLWLISQLGANGAQIVAEGLGAAAPRAPNDTDQGRQKNRRVEVITTPTQSVTP
jgi:OOP family OmpA-OmpF porin